MTFGKQRRSAIKGIVAGTATFTASGLLLPFTSYAQEDGEKAAMLKGNINHSVSRWCFEDMSVDALCAAAKEMGITGIDLVGPKDWPVLKKYNLESTMCNGAEISLTEGWNDKRYHATLLKNYKEMIPLVAQAGYKNLICFSGNRNGMDDETGLKNAAAGLKQLIPFAEKYQVVLVMELLNSKINHKDYQCDNTAWGVALAKEIGSENFKLLYDIYHMQVNEGDIIRTIRDNHQYIAHYHTAGVPGRHEIDDTQELNYPAIMQAIKATGFKGFVAQEFIPTAKDMLASLKEAIKICDV